MPEAFELFGRAGRQTERGRAVLVIGQAEIPQAKLRLPLQTRTNAPVGATRSDRFRRISPVAGRPGKGPLTEATADTRPGSGDRVKIAGIRLCALQRFS